jgi:hypothetical protein
MEANQTKTSNEARRSADGQSRANWYFHPNFTAVCMAIIVVFLKIITAGWVEDSV